MLPIMLINSYIINTCFNIILIIKPCQLNIYNITLLFYFYLVFVLYKIYAYIDDVNFILNIVG